MVDENTIVDAFVSSININLKTSLGLKTIEAYEGTIEDAVKRLQRYPSILVLLERVDYTEGDETGDLLEGDPTVALLIGNKSLQSRTQARKGAYDMMKACRQLLHNTSVEISDSTWRIKEQHLVNTQGGLNIYRQAYQGLNVYFD